ncbi:uncharacterized protein O3C94_015185 [Discoglossus pictus]
MKTIAACIFVILLNCQTGYTLKCYIGGCGNNDCHNLGTMICGDGQACGTSEATAHGVTVSTRSCTPTSACGTSIGDGFNFNGASSQKSTITCCYTDLCNSAGTNKIALLTAGLCALLALCLSKM